MLDCFQPLLKAIGQLTGGPLVGLIATVASLRAGMVASAALLLPTLPLLARAGRQAAAEAAAPLPLEQPRGRSWPGA